MRTTVTFRNPVEWIWVDIKNVPKGKREKVKSTFAALDGKGGSGLLEDKKTLYVLVEASKNTKDGVREYFQSILDELRLPRATIEITGAWTQAVALYPFVSDESRLALEERLKMFQVAEVAWLPNAGEVILWTQTKLRPNQITGITQVFR